MQILKATVLSKLVGADLYEIQTGQQIRHRTTNSNERTVTKKTELIEEKCKTYKVHTSSRQGWVCNKHRGR